MFDEPMSALDSYLKSALEQNMLDLFDVCNRTVLYVSHDIDEACRLCERICVMHDGHMEEIGSVEDVVRRPQTLAALRLTGCKNTSRARKIGDEEVEALDWGMTFNVGREVPDNVAYLGIRASYFHVDNRAERGRNSYDLHVARVSDSRFERLVLLDVPRADAPTRCSGRSTKCACLSTSCRKQARRCACILMPAGSIWFVDNVTKGQSLCHMRGGTPRLALVSTSVRRPRRRGGEKRMAPLRGPVSCRRAGRRSMRPFAHWRSRRGPARLVTRSRRRHAYTGGTD